MDRSSQFIGGKIVLLIAFMAALLLASSAGADQDKLVLLGTKGGPRVTANSSSQPGSLLVMGGRSYVIDCGYEVTRKLVQAKFKLPTLRYIFITHHHSDHNLEYPNLVYNAWASGLKTPVDAFGPAGLIEMNRLAWELNRFDIEIRIADEGRPDLRKLVTAHEYGEGVVFQDDKIKVSALRVQHPPITEAYALKFEAGGKVVVFSGDTAHFPPLIEFAKGADILVHEVMYVPALEALIKRNPNAATLMSHLMASHTTSEEVGRIAAAAGVKTLVLNHFVPGDDPAVPDQNWLEDAAKHFKGKIIVGKDLLEIPLD